MWLTEIWAEFCAGYSFNSLGLEDKASVNGPMHGLFKGEILEELHRYERAGSPFENSMRGEWMIFENDWLYLPEEGVLYALGENFGYEIFRNLRNFPRFSGETAREDAILLMYQLYPAIDEPMWPFFERWNFPIEEDTDNDALSNKKEIQLGSNPIDADSDGDGLNDAEELAIGTNPINWDTDNDGYSDGDEVNLYGTNPLDPNDYPAGKPGGYLGGGLEIILLLVGVVIVGLVAVALLLKRH